MSTALRQALSQQFPLVALLIGKVSLSVLPLLDGLGLLAAGGIAERGFMNEMREDMIGDRQQGIFLGCEQT
jgi:hypothetical protein